MKYTRFIIVAVAPLFVFGCSEVQSSASRVLDNAGSVARTAKEKIIMEPTSPTGRSAETAPTTAQEDQSTSEEKQKHSS